MASPTQGTSRNGSLYTPLDPSNKEIRLLRVAPYDADDVFSVCECTMIKASLSQNPLPKYNAFSYEWNYSIAIPEIGTSVVVNGHRLQVTKNLAALLTRYRNIAQSAPDWKAMQIPIWIDALCIDQANAEERNHQVGLMGAIYSSAQATLAWLGESEDDSDYAMPIIGDIGSKIIHSMKGDTMAWVEPEQQAELWQPYQDESSGSLNQFWTGVGALMKRSYWKRAWIVQEVLLQLNVIIFCGKFVLHYHQLNALHHWLHGIQGKPCPPSVNIELWGLLSTTAGWYSMGFNNFLTRRSFKPPEGTGTDAIDERERHLRWKTWIINTMYQQATDPRDNLYSVLGLVGVDMLQPDYSDSIETVFYNFATTNIRIEGSLGILTYAGHWELPESTDMGTKTPAASLFVPSWVPNWDQISKMYSFSWLFTGNDEADKDWPSVFVIMDQQVPWSINGNILVTPGVFFDVVSLSRVCDVNDGSWLSFCLDHINAQAGQPYPSGIPILQALARLVLRGRKFPNREPLEPFPDVVTVFQSVLPGFLATIHSAGQDLKEAQERLGISTHEGIVEKFIGKPFNTIIQELARALPRLHQLVDEWKVPTTSNDPWTSPYPDSMNFRRDTVSSMDQYAVFVTSKGYIGWGRKGLDNGDRVCVVPGCPMPVLLRNVNSHNIHLGPCYVEGLMHGEAISCVRNGTAQVETFHIM